MFREQNRSIRQFRELHMDRIAVELPPPLKPGYGACPECWRVGCERCAWSGQVMVKAVESVTVADREREDYDGFKSNMGGYTSNLER